METIRSYIDNLFRSYSHTPRVQKARAELLEIMEDKYNELKSQGRSENEAIGIVISEFGNMEEIAAELEVDTSLDSRKDGDDREVYSMNSDQVKEFVTKQISGGHMIALGVVLCILAPGMACIITTLGDVGVFPRALADTLGGIWLIGMVAAGVSCFITAGVRKDSYEMLLGIGKVTASSGKEDKVMSVISSVYWLTVTLIYLLWSFYNNAWVTSWVIWPVAGIAFGIVSVIVKSVTGKEN